MRKLQQGEGWRLGWDESAVTFAALVGGADWAIELTRAEFTDFSRLLLQLVSSVEQMQAELMAEEAIACEAQGEYLWMEVRGYPQQLELNFILLQGRRGEGHWPATVVPHLLQALQAVAVF